MLKEQNLIVSEFIRSVENYIEPYDFTFMQNLYDVQHSNNQMKKEIMNSITETILNNPGFGNEYLFSNIHFPKC